MRKVRKVNSYHAVEKQDEYHELIVDCFGGQVVVQLPYACDFKEIKITKRDSSENNCVIQVRGLDRFSTSDTFLTLESEKDWILLESDGNETWRIVSFSRSLFDDEVFVSEEEEEKYVEMLPPPLPEKEEEKSSKTGYYAAAAIAALGGLAAWALS